MGGRLPFGQLFLATILGVTAGVYIYRPIILQYHFERKALQSDVSTTEAVKKDNE